MSKKTKRSKKPEKPTVGPHLDEVPVNYGNHEWGVRSLVEYRSRAKDAKDTKTEHIMPFTTKQASEDSFKAAVEQAETRVEVVKRIELLHRPGGKGQWQVKRHWVKR